MPTGRTGRDNDPKFCGGLQRTLETSFSKFSSKQFSLACLQFYSTFFRRQARPNFFDKVLGQHLFPFSQCALQFVQSDFSKCYSGPTKTWHDTSANTREPRHFRKKSANIQSWNATYLMVMQKTLEIRAKQANQALL